MSTKNRAVNTQVPAKVSLTGVSEHLSSDQASPHTPSVFTSGVNYREVINMVGKGILDSCVSF